MTKERFTEILKEYDYSDAQIEVIWNSRPEDDIDEERLRKTVKATSPMAEAMRRRVG